VKKLRKLVHFCRWCCKSKSDLLFLSHGVSHVQRGMYCIGERLRCQNVSSLKIKFLERLTTRSPTLLCATRVYRVPFLQAHRAQILSQSVASRTTKVATGQKRFPSIHTAGTRDGVDPMGRSPIYGRIWDWRQRSAGSKWLSDRI